MFMNFLAAVLLTSCILFLIFGIKHFSRKEIDVHRFNMNYAYQQPQQEVLTTKKIKHQVPLSKAVPLVVLGGVTIAIVTYSIAGVGWISILTSFGGLLFPKLWLDSQIDKQKMEIEMGMELASETMATVLRSGGNISEALERAALDARAPLNTYLIEAATKIRTGTSPTIAILEFNERVPLRELGMISVGMNLQQKGMPINLPEMFFEVQKNIRQRLAFRGDLRVITTENKMAAWLVGSIPFCTIALLRQMAPELVEPLFTTPMGLLTAAVCTGTIGIGIYWIMQMIKPVD